VTTTGRAITLGATVSGTLSLLQTDLNNVTAGILRVGNRSDSGCRGCAGSRQSGRRHRRGKKYLGRRDS